MKYFSLIIVTIIILFILLYPGKIPNSIEAIGRIMPCREWIITRGRDGLLMATLRNHVQGTVETYSVTQFERGDPVKFSFNRFINSGTHVSAGDTVGWIDSSEIERQLVQLEGELKTQRALLSMAETGEKESLIQEAEKRLEHAREQVEEQQKIVKRTKNLFETNFLPEQDYEIAKSTLRLFELNIEIAEAQLQTVQSGTKKEEIDMISSQINAFEKDIDALSNKYKQYNITSPLSGTVFEISSGDTLLIIGDTSSYLVTIPLQVKNRKYISNRQDVKVDIEGLGIPLYGRIVKRGNVVHVLNGNQVFIAIARLSTDNHDLLPGMFGKCSVICEPLRPREYIIRQVKSLFGR